MSLLEIHPMFAWNETSSTMKVHHAGRRDSFSDWVSFLTVVSQSLHIETIQYYYHHHEQQPAVLLRTSFILETKDQCGKGKIYLKLPSLYGRLRQELWTISNCIVSRHVQFNQKMRYALKRSAVFVSGTPTPYQPLEKKPSLEPPAGSMAPETLPPSPFQQLVNQHIDSTSGLPRDYQELCSATSRFFQEQYDQHVQEKTSLDEILQLVSAWSHQVDCIDGIAVENNYTEIRSMAYGELVTFLVPRLVILDPSTMTPNQIAQALSWSNSHVAPVSSALVRTWTEELKSEYLRRGVHEQVKSMIENRLLLVEEDDIITNDDGTLSTRLPLDVSIIVEMQLSVARESLPSFLVPAVLEACNEELINLVGGLMFEVETKWRNFTPERLCCFINDAQSLLEQCEQRWEDMSSSDGEENDSSESLLREFTELSLHATRYLCERIFLDVSEILAEVGSVHWEEEESHIKTVILTMEDYFEDIKIWVPEGYFFPKILKNCVDLILRIYLDSFFANTMSNGLDCPERAAQSLQSDWEKLWIFFGTTKLMYHGRAGFYDKENIWHRLHIVEAMIPFLMTDVKPENLQDVMQVILKQLGTDGGSAAIFHLFGLQQRNVTVAEAQQWHETVALAVEHLKMRGASSDPLYCIVDLRNSKFIKRMKPSRRLSSELVDVTSTNMLVKQRRASSRLIRSSRRLLGSDRSLISDWRLEEEVAPERAIFGARHLSGRLGNSFRT
jgi:hypothetical protein